MRKMAKVDGKLIDRLRDRAPFDVGPYAEIFRPKVSKAERTNGAWRWLLVDPDSTMTVGGEWTVTEMTRAV